MMKDRKIDIENWEEIYKRKLVSLEEAAKVVKSGDNIFIPSSYMGHMPTQIAERADELRNVIVEAQAPGPTKWIEEGMEGSFTIIPRIYLGPSAREARDEGRLSFLPYTNGTWCKGYRDGRPMKRNVDISLIDVSAPDENGFMTFGACVWERRGYVQAAKTIIAEINEDKIRSYGDTWIHVSQVDYIVRPTFEALTQEEKDILFAKIPERLHEKLKERMAEGSPRALRAMIDRLDDMDMERLARVWGEDEPDEAVIAIARHLKPLMRDADTIQIGIGRPSKYIVDLGVFDECNDLAIFTEMGCPGMGNLVMRGIATGKYATLHPGKAVFGALTGLTQDEQKWAENNPLFEQYGVDYVANFANVMKQKNMLAINNATQIDLIGQITCETQFGSRMINGPGGQIEMHMGAFAAPGGRAITLLNSTWGDGGISTIVPYLEEGSMVTIPRSYADFVITEWGVAELYGKTHKERAEALIAIAHPDFRDELREAAKDIY
jgi:4-hydroxybutyrate CoA-transferase